MPVGKYNKELLNPRKPVLQKRTHKHRYSGICLPRPGFSIVEKRIQEYRAQITVPNPERHAPYLVYSVPQNPISTGVTYVATGCVAWPSPCGDGTCVTMHAGLMLPSTFLSSLEPRW